MIFVGKRRPDRSRCAALVAVVEVINVMIVEVDGLLHQPQTQYLEAEVQVALGVIHGGGHMVQAKNRMIHLLIIRRGPLHPGWLRTLRADATGRSAILIKRRGPLHPGWLRTPPRGRYGPLRTFGSSAGAPCTPASSAPLRADATGRSAL